MPERTTRRKVSLKGITVACSLSSLCLFQNVAVYGFSTSYHPRAHSIHSPLLVSTHQKSARRSVSLEEEKSAHQPDVSGLEIDSSPDTTEETKTPFYKFPEIAYKIYTTYAKRLWKETGVSARKEVTNDKVRGAIRNMQSVLVHAKEYAEFDDATYEAQLKLMTSCKDMLKALPEPEKPKEKKKKKKKQQKESTTLESTALETTALESTALETTEDETTSEAAPPKKKQRSILFGALMGLAVALWVFSGNYIFTALFCLMTILGQLEYYRMVMNTGVYAARRISIVGASSMFLTALFAPNLHQICLPIFGLWSMIWFLTKRRQFATIPDIATTFTGMFYLGYVPSFWVRIRLLGAGMEPTRLYQIMGPIRGFLTNKFGIIIPDRLIHFPITTGAVFIFWSWLSLAFSDVGAYFVGRKYGKTKLGEISPAAGATSPNKTVEGVIGGCALSAILSIIGAWVQKWPYFVLTGAIHGAILALLGLIGDLTASMLKRDSGLKDFGDLIPEHGGILDRVDSFIWTAPYSWLVCQYIIPALKAGVAP